MGLESLNERECVYYQLKSEECANETKIVKHEIQKRNDFGDLIFGDDLFMWCITFPVLMMLLEVIFWI